MHEERMLPPARTYTASCDVSILVEISFKVEILGSQTLLVNITKEFNPSKILLTCMHAVMS